MSDAGRLAEWKPGFEDWKQASMPLLQQGKAKQAFARYPWFSTEQVPFARLGRPASEARFALITTGGYSIEGEQAPFRPLPNLDGSEPEIREIPLDVDRAKLRIDHPGYDHRFAEEDLNVNLPLDRLNELVAAGEIGSISPNTQVLMGLVPDVVPLIEETIPLLVARLEADSVDAALLVPS